MSLPHAIGLSLALLGGPSAFDGRLADYQWDVRPQASLGAALTAETGRYGLGVRVTRSHTTQVLGIPDPASAATVHATTLEGVGSVRLFALAGCAVRADVTSGWLHLGYAPDRIDVPAGGGNPAIRVTLDPIDAWIGGAGLGIRRDLAGRWSVGGAVERRIFSLETAHRNGAAIETGRESFGDWSARLELGCRLLRP